MRLGQQPNKQKERKHSKSLNYNLQPKTHYNQRADSAEVEEGE